MTTRKGRLGERPLVTKQSMHLVLRSTKARGKWSFLRPDNKKKVRSIVHKFSNKYGVRIHSLANVGNHLHFHLQLTNRHTYKPFIRALTASIAMAVTGVNRWTKRSGQKAKFWDYRPYTKVVMSLRQFLNLRDYVQINQYEGYGVERATATYLVKSARNTS